MKSKIALKTPLYEHQVKAVDKMLPLKVGALFMEMGTGKTRVALELIALRQARITNIVWFCPFSIKWALAEEINKHMENDLVYVFNDKTTLKNIPFHRLHIVGIESVSSSPNTVFCLHEIIKADSYIVVDESFYIKNPAAKRTIWIKELTKICGYKLILTGTPIAHSIIDLYAQIRFLSHKIFGYRSYYAFSKNHIEIIEEEWGYSQKARNTDYLAAKLEPYVYQVSKEKCLDLPDKIYQAHYFEMSFDQRENYKLAKDELLYSLDLDDFKYHNILKLFTVLQQIVCGFKSHATKTETFDNNRIQVLIDILNYIPPDKKVIIFCKYHYDIQTISEALKGQKISLYHGKLKEKTRKRQLEAFRAENRILLSTIGSGGHGLTLNEAQYTIFYNNTFKYTDRIQAEDRNHRIGQESSPNYIDIICKKSIDMKIERAFELKSNVIDMFKNQVRKAEDIEQREKFLETL